jgi:hypothetical protein
MIATGTVSGLHELFEPREEILALALMLALRTRIGP